MVWLALFLGGLFSLSPLDDRWSNTITLPGQPGDRAEQQLDRHIAGKTPLPQVECLNPAKFAPNSKRLLSVGDASTTTSVGLNLALNGPDAATIALALLPLSAPRLRFAEHALCLTA